MDNEGMPDGVAEVVIDVLQRSGVSRKAIAARTGIPYSSLGRKLAGDTPFSLSEIWLIAEAIDVAPSSLLPGARMRSPLIGVPIDDRSRAGLGHPFSIS